MTDRNKWAWWTKDYTSLSSESSDWKENRWVVYLWTWSYELWRSSWWFYAVYINLSSCKLKT